MLRIHRTKLSQSKFSRMSWLRLAGIVSCCALTLVFGLMLFPALPQVTYAAIPEVTPSTGTSVGINLPASIDFESVTPTPDGATTTATANLTVTTTNSASYSLYLYSSDGNNSLRPKISSLANISKINATAGDVGLTLSSLKPNTWGYNLGTSVPNDNTTYSAVPTDNSTPIQTKDTSDTNSANDTYTLSFGAKVDTTTASGAYSNTLTIAVVAEPKKISSLTELTYMQEMTPEICVNSQENDTARLIDSRDGKYYWVAKLKDGNCWMTQNLALDLSVDTPLTAEDSDVTNAWAPQWSTVSDSTIGTMDNTGTLSWNLGNYVSASPTSWEQCGAESVDSPAWCSTFVDVSNMAPMEEISGSGAIVSDGYYDAHYLVGNYYQWSTATAGTGDSLTSADASDSICPKGWKLPTSNNAEPGSFAYLINLYGYSSGSDLVAQPLYYVNSGFIEINRYSSEPQTRAASRSGVMLATNGNYWSSTAGSSASAAYRLSFYSGSVYSSGSDTRYTGQSVRCLAR